MDSPRPNFEPNKGFPTMKKLPTIDGSGIKSAETKKSTIYKGIKCSKSSTCMPKLEKQHKVFNLLKVILLAACRRCMINES